jgi:hypothetical protein
MPFCGIVEYISFCRNICYMRAMLKISMVWCLLAWHSWSFIYFVVCLLSLLLLFCDNWLPITTAPHSTSQHLTAEHRIAMESRPSSSQYKSSLLLKRRAAARPEMKGAKGANTTPITTTTTPSSSNSSSSNGTKQTSRKRHGPRKYCYNVSSFKLIVPCRLGHKAPGSTSLLVLLEMPRPNIHQLLYILNNHPEVSE